MELPTKANNERRFNMLTRFYSFVWMVYVVSAGVLWLGNVFTLFTAVVFGFIAFGLIFAGMMCVLPTLVAHPPVRLSKTRLPKMELEPAVRPVNVANGRVHPPLKLRIH